MKPNFQNRRSTGFNSISAINNSPVSSNLGNVAKDITNNLINSNLERTTGIKLEGDTVGALTNVASQILKRGKSRGGVSKKSGNGNGSFKSQPRNGGGSNVPRQPSLDYSATPIELNLNTGIVANAYADIYHDATADSSPLHITNVGVTIPGSGELWNYFEVVLSFQFINAIQGAVSFSVNASLFTAANLRDTFNSLLNALQVYYFYDSILVYTSNPLNRNEGMLALREQISAEDLNNLSNLRKILLGTPIPPNMRTFCAYLYQTFSSSSLPGSGLIKVSPFAWTLSGGSLVLPTDNIFNAISALNTYRDTFALISRACPNWILPSIPSSNAIPVHDLQFSTIWANLPYLAQSGTVDRYPSATNQLEDVVYNSYTNNLDGAAYSLSSIYNEEISDYMPSLVTVYPTTYEASPVKSTTRLSFVLYDGDAVFKESIFSRDVACSRGETYTVVTGADATAYRSFGTEGLLGVNGLAVTQTSYKTLEWMLNIDSIPRRDMRNRR